MSPSVASSISSIEAVKYGLKTETPRTPLSEHVDAIEKMSLEDSINAVSDLLDQLKPYLSYGGKRYVKHPNYKGKAELRRLGCLWMDQGSRCCDENASFPLRLKQYSLLWRFQRLYRESNLGVEKSKVVWLLAPFRDFRLECGCCARDPFFCIPYGERCSDALGVRREVYEKYWPKQKQSYWSYNYGRDGSRFEYACVKVKDLEDVIDRESQHKVAS